MSLLSRLRTFPERKMFSCVWLHFKKCFEKYFLMFGYVLENIIENTFSTCCSHFSHIFSVAKRIYNIIHSLKHKQNPEKNHQIRTFRAIAIDASRRRSRCTDRSDHDRADRDLSDRADRDLAFVCPDLMIFFWVLFMF